MHQRLSVGICLAITSVCSLNAGYLQTNLVSDINGLALATDASLKNPWGISFGPTTPFWISDQATNVSTLYNTNLAPANFKQGLVVSTPLPTGQVFNTSNSFILPVGSTKALFIFASLNGSINFWNGAQGTTAVAEFVSANSVYTGLALGSNAGSDLLYAADFANAKIDVVNSSYALASSGGAFPFTDPNLPSGYSPYNIQNIGGNLYVEYDKVDPVTHRPTTTANTGVVDIFSPAGALLQRLVTNAQLNSPWGVALAPAGFGPFGGDLLVGNFGDGTISAFDPTTGAFLGKVSDLANNPIVNSGLWALSFRAPGSGFDPNTLFITAGINGEADGLFAQVQAVPEPASIGLFALGLGAIAFWRRKARG